MQYELISRYLYSKHGRAGIVNLITWQVTKLIFKIIADEMSVDPVT